MPFGQQGFSNGLGGPGLNPSNMYRGSLHPMERETIRRLQSQFGDRSLESMRERELEALPEETDFE